ncbi:hypothetical protein [Pseudomonas sp. R1-43-08]|uniref:hypothetical protein n=1 Tax=Pseudomonas sp. R1-43-08 TaxID=1173270 RepID=UPI000F5807F0|nr:hypothetical protein [Pseudomonas sp. R1-43-08]
MAELTYDLFCRRYKSHDALNYCYNVPANAASERITITIKRKTGRALLVPLYFLWRRANSLSQKSGLSFSLSLAAFRANIEQYRI